MKKTIFILGLLSSFLIGTVEAQDYTRLAKQAKRALSNYYIDPANKSDELKEAKDLIIEAFSDPAANNDYDALFIKGQVLSEYVAAENIAKSKDPSYESKTSGLTMDAIEALKSALKLADKKFKVNEVLKSMAFHAANISNEGIFAFQDQDFGLAYNALNESLEVKKILDENKSGDSFLKNEDDLNNQMYYTALAAQLANKNEEASKLYSSLLDRGYNTSEIYEGLYRVNYDSNKEEAVKYLQKGRETYPDSTNLLYAEINHYLKEGKIESLEDQLLEGIEKDPENASLHVTLGNVYDRLYQKEFEAGNDEKSAAYFSKSIEKYKDAIALDADNTDALYSIGALYFNKAAIASKELEDLSTDFSAAGQKKYDKKKMEIDGYFKEALPWFEKSEQSDPNDVNTLIALKEIYANQNSIEKSNEFKSRLEKVRAGEELDSYFK